MEQTDDDGPVAWAPAGPMAEPATVEEVAERGPLLLRGRRARALLADPDRWRGEITEGQPWAQLLVAAALDERNPGDPEAVSLLDAAERGFAAASSVDGASACALVAAAGLYRQGRRTEASQAWRRATAGGRDGGGLVALATLESLEVYAQGELAEAVRLAQDGYGWSRLVGDGVEAARALVFLSYFAFAKGDLARLSQLLDRARSAFRDVDDRRDCDEVVLLRVVEGMLASVRGDVAGHRTCFEEAASLAVELAAPWYRTVVAANRAEAVAWLGAGVDESRAALHQRVARRDGPDVSQPGVVERALGMAAMADGDPEEAERQLRRAIELLEPLAERGRARLALGELLVTFGDQVEARAVLDTAKEELTAAGASYWLARCLLWLGRADPGQAPRFDAMAHTLDDGDIAFRILFAPPGGMRVRRHPAPEVEIGGQPVAFATRNAELTVHLLALAGPEGIPADELAARLWSDADASRLRPRVRTMLWHARTALGSESWRLRREGGRLVLDTAGASVEPVPAGSVPDLPGFEDAAPLVAWVHASRA